MSVFVRALWILLACSWVLGQQCQRTITVGLTVGLGLGAPSPMGRVQWQQFSLGPEDFEASLQGQPLRVVRVEPVQSGRVLVVIQASPYHLKGHRKQFEKMMNRLAGIYTEQMPANMSVAYEVDTDKVSFFTGFSSDPGELRVKLDEMISKAKSGVVDGGSRDLSFDESIRLFGQPQPGDSMAMIAFNPSYSNWSETEMKLLQRGIRLFIVLSELDILNAGVSDDNQNAWQSMNAAASRTGGHGFAVTSDSFSKKQEDQNWEFERNFWLNGFNSFYQITVEVPFSVPQPKSDKPSWSLRLRDSTKRRLGVIPNGIVPLDYPSLLLCDSATIAQRPQHTWPLD